MNKNISVWRGSKTPPSNYHVWINEENDILLYNETEWKSIIDINDTIDTELTNNQVRTWGVTASADGVNLLGKNNNGATVHSIDIPAATTESAGVMSGANIKRVRKMKYGTHNSATGGKLLWWLRPIGGVINLTSKCQSRTIADQLADGVRVFNLQVSFVGGKWRFSHGLAVYKEDVFETLAMMKSCAVEEPIYFQLYMDKCIWATNSETAFAQLVADIKKQFCSPEFVMLCAWIEGTDKYPHKSSRKISLEEKYWTLNWSKDKSWIDKLPLPKRHAKKFNKEYKDKCKSKYLMLDFYEY